MPCEAGMSAALLRALWGASRRCTATRTHVEGRSLLLGLQPFAGVFRFTLLARPHEGWNFQWTAQRPRPWDHGLS